MWFDIGKEAALEGQTAMHVACMGRQLETCLDIIHHIFYRSQSLMLKAIIYKTSHFVLHVTALNFAVCARIGSARDCPHIVA